MKRVFPKSLVAHSEAELTDVEFQDENIDDIVNVDWLRSTTLDDGVWGRIGEESNVSFVFKYFS